MAMPETAVGFVFAVEPIEGHVRFSLWVLAVGLGIGVSAAGAAGAGSIVVRLQTDPAPAGVAWSYSGVGQAFQLRASGSSSTISGLADGTYRQDEAAAEGQANTFTTLRGAYA